MRRRLPLLCLLLALSLAACDSGDDDTADRAADQNATTVPGDADPEAVAVIAEWADTLRSGDVAGAAELFALPSLAENGPSAFAISDRADARRFNASLPCGARLIEARTESGYTVATFELTERPGRGSCGDGTGSEATTAFLVESGEIVEWRRVFESGAPAPSVDA